MAQQRLVCLRNTPVMFLALQLAASLLLCSSDFLAGTAVYKSLVKLFRLERLLLSLGVCTCRHTLS